MNDDEFLSAFESCSLPEAEWTHKAHVRMAWLYLQQRPLVEVIPVVCAGIRRYNRSLSKELAYHETITQAFLHLIHDRLERGGRGLSFEEFCDRHSDLVDRGVAVLLVHYQKETLFSDEARSTFVLPDRAGLPGCQTE